MRNPFFDVLKFFAILLVVYRHAIKMFGCSVGQPFVDNFIVGMNMPIFFIISGYFAAKTIEAGDWRKLGKHIYGYFWPLAAASVVFAVLAVLFNIPGSEKGLIGYAGRRFLFSSWFLWCLAICFSIAFLCCRLNVPVLRVGCVLLLIVGLPFLCGVWHMHSTRAMLPFFCFGAFILRRWELWKCRWIGVFSMLVYLLCVLLQGSIGKNGLSFYRMETTWQVFLTDYEAFPLYLARLINGIAGSIGIMWGLYLLCDKHKGVAKMASFGTTTLWVYILHPWLLDRIVGLGWFNTSVWCALMWTVLLFGVSHACGLAIRRVKVDIWYNMVKR